MANSQSTRGDWRTILTLGFSLLGMLYFLIQSLALGGLWLTSFSPEPLGGTQNGSHGLLLWSSLLSALLLFPLFLLSLYQLRKKPIPKWLDPQNTVIQKWMMDLIFVWPLFVFLGWWVAEKPVISAFLLGPLNLLAVGLPVLWVLTAARRKLNGGQPIRQWRIFGSSLTLLPLIVILVELLTVLFVTLIIGLFLVYSISLDSRLEGALTNIANQIEGAGEDIELIIQLLRPYLSQPFVIVWALIVFGGIIPVVEEVLKPIVLWGLAASGISPQEGFVGGLLCGAGFALMENILYLAMAVTAQDWLLLTIARAGTGAMHMLGSGLMGWGLARAWHDEKWGFLGLTSLAAFLLHGFWNVLALAVGIAPLFIMASEPSLWQTIMFNSPLILLFILSLIGLIVINRYLWNKSKQEPALSALNSNAG